MLRQEKDTVYQRRIADIVQAQADLLNLTSVAAHTVRGLAAWVVACSEAEVVDVAKSYHLPCLDHPASAAAQSHPSAPAVQEVLFA